MSRGRQVAKGGQVCGLGRCAWRQEPLKRGAFLTPHDKLQPICRALAEWCPAARYGAVIGLPPGMNPVRFSPTAQHKPVSSVVFLVGSALASIAYLLGR